MKTVKTITATIYVGLRHGYTKKICPVSRVRKAAQEYVNRVRLCVTVTPTEFIYVEGSEPGVIVGLINYPRFPSTKKVIKKQAMELAEILKRTAQQLKVSVVLPESTIMIGG